MSSYSLLCLGDSYTIGEMVLPSENFPNQTVKLLNKDGYEFEDAEIIATTGWTTDELQDAIDQHHFKPSYDFVTLLIGVNDQYRGRTTEDYKPQFESLLKQAINFANNKQDHVIVISIPDWGVTTFAKNSGRNQQQVSKEIDEYNIANKQVSEAYKANYIDITPSTREAAQDLSLLAEDGLHPSAKEYAKWSLKLFSAIIETPVKK
ncbi:MAG TPA: GDSL-type esterase/lipase family protein [Chitinophagaceae bacterium]